MHHTLKALKPRDIAKNSINAAIATATYTQTKDQILARTEHDPDDITVRVGATAAASTASAFSRRYTDVYVDKIADWLAARRSAKKSTQEPAVSK
jgi:hypothetical protein